MQQFSSTQELFNKTLPKKHNPITPETAVDAGLLCKTHMRYYDQKVIRSPISGEWLRVDWLVVGLIPELYWLGLELRVLVKLPGCWLVENYLVVFPECSRQV